MKEKRQGEQNTWEKLKSHQKFSGKGAHSENTERSKENVWRNNGLKLPQLYKDTNISIQKFQQTPSEMNL